MSQPTYIVTTDQPTTVVVSPDQVVASVPANVQGPAGPAGPAPSGTGLVRVTDGVASTLTHPSPSPAGSYTLASITVDAFGRVTSASNGTVTAATISDSTAVGRSLLTAADAAAARSAIGAGTGNALTSGTLAQFAATTSAELAVVLTDETGSGGGFVRATGPTLTTPVVSGTLAVYQTGQSGVSTARVDVSHDGTDTRVNSLSGRIRLIGGSGQGIVIQGAGGTVGGILLLNSTHGALTVWDGWPLLHSASGRLGVQSTTVVGWPSTLDASASPVLGIARLDDNTIEINNGTRTASGGALRGLSVSTLTAATGAAGGTGISVTGTGSNVEQIRLTTGSGGAVPAIVLSQGAGGIPSGSVELSFSSPKLGLRRTGLDHFCYYSTATGDTVLDSVFGGAGAEIRSGGTLRIRATSAGTAITGPLTLGTYTVATLPSASANAGAFAQVTDSNSTTNGNTVAGGGSNRVPVFSNGTNWIIK